MNDLKIFFNTQVENAGTLSWIGDAGLASFRYLFHGKTIRIQHRALSHKIEIHHVASFHRDNWHTSKTNPSLISSPTSMIRTAVSIVLLIPGFVIGAIFKGVAYLYKDVKKRHRLIEKHFIPINRQIGSADQPIRSIQELSRALAAEFRANPKHPPTNALTIYGNRSFEIDEDPGILQFNPKRLLLSHIGLVHQSSSTNHLDDGMMLTGKWEIKPELTHHLRGGTGNGNEPAVQIRPTNSVEEALAVKAPKTHRLFGQDLNLVFYLT